MNGWAWIILTGAWLGAVAAAVSGLGLMGWAVLGRRRTDGAMTWARTGVPNTAEIEAASWGTDEVVSPRRAACDCCGYELRGLESGHCPECGWSYRTDRVPRRKRLRAAVWGCVLLLAAPVMWKAPVVVRSGPAAAVPSVLLAEALPYVPWDDSAVHRELAARLWTNSMTASARRTLAARCTEIIASGRAEPVRVAAATLLAGAGSAGQEAESLTALMNDPSASVRRRLVETLHAVAADQERITGPRRGGSGEGAVPCLVWTALTDSNAQVRRDAVVGLTGLTQLGRRADVFVVALKDPAPEVRERALYAIHTRWSRGQDRVIGRNSTDAAIEAVEHAMNDPHTAVREAAVYTLGRLAAVVDRAVLALAPALHDPAPDIRREAADRLCFLGHRAAPAWADLMLSIDDDDPAVQRAVLDALVAIRGHVETLRRESAVGQSG